MTRSRWFILGALIGLLALPGAASAQLVPLCSPVLNDQLCCSDGTYVIGQTIEYTITIEVPASGPGTPNCVLTDVKVWFFPPPIGAPTTGCAAPEGSDGAVLIATIPVINPGDGAHTFTSADNPVLSYVVQPSDAGHTVKADLATWFFAGDNPIRQCDEKPSINTVPCPLPCINVTKTVDCATSKVGDQVVYSIAVQNCGTFNLTNVQVTDPRLGPGALSGFPSTLTPGQQVSVNFPYTILPGDEPGPVSNQAHAVGTDACDPTKTATDDSDIVLVRLIHPSFDLTETCLTNPVPPGGNADFGITITNTGDVALNFTTDQPEIGPFSLNAGQTFTQTVTRGPAQSPEICNDVIVNATIPPEFCNLTNTYQKTFHACCPVSGQEGCTPGFWKNNTECWCDAYTPDMLVGSVFTIPSQLSQLADDTLLEALAYQGGAGVIGKARNLLRHAVAGLLNACNDNVNYPISTASLISQVNAALATLDPAQIEALQTILAGYNQLGCPIDAHCRLIVPEGDTKTGAAQPLESLNRLPSGTPDELVVMQSAPNPFKQTVQLQYGLPAAGAVRIEIVDVGGRVVRSVMNSEQAAGYHMVMWDGRNGSGERMSTGVYFFRVQYQGTTVAKRMLMLQ